MLALLLATLPFLVQPQAPQVITPATAAQHVGERVIVQGTITQIVLSVNLTTHINFGGLYPKHVFTATIFKANQPLFEGVKELEGKRVNVEGVIRLYRGKPEIVLELPTQLRAVE
jgi:DNA/RNA endonuclease YhcR with UshA esterase domain